MLTYQVCKRVFRCPEPLVSPGESGIVDHACCFGVPHLLSWNHVAGWLRQVHAVRTAA